MSEIWQIMGAALAASLILVGIHGYLGIHIIARGVIFVDLALAQVAAMGWAAASLGLAAKVSAVTGLPPDEAAYVIGVGATLLGAALLSVTRVEHTYVPQEAIIGIVYVVASAGTILLAARAPMGSEHIEELLTGTLLWVTWPQILKTGLLYGSIGVAHWLLRKRFFTISLKPEEAKRRGWSIRWWDFVFYGLFGFVVTSSVHIAGVLVVFSFLVIPAVIAFLFTTSPARLLAVAWATGSVATIVGLLTSYKTDLPTGPTIVCAFALALVLAFGLRKLIPLPLATGTRDEAVVVAAQENVEA
jgi:zinc/manganese transport system permease protein